MLGMISRSETLSAHNLNQERSETPNWARSSQRTVNLEGAPRIILNHSLIELRSTELNPLKREVRQYLYALYSEDRTTIAELPPRLS